MSKCYEIICEGKVNRFITVEADNEEEAKKLAEFRKNDTASNKLIVKDKTTLFENTKNKDELNIIIKSDVQGSSEALQMAINYRSGLFRRYKSCR